MGSDRNDGMNRPQDRQHERPYRPSRQDGQDTVDHLVQRSAPEEEDVPFEDASDEQRAGFNPDKSTITPRERQTFEKLFSLQKQAKPPGQRDGTGVQNYKVQNTSLDAILDSAMSDITTRSRHTPKFPPALQPMAEEARSKNQLTTTLAIRTNDDSARSKEIQRDYTHVTKLMTSAPSDQETWKILKGLVLNRVAALRLDVNGESTTYQTQAGKSWAKTETNILKKKRSKASVFKDAPNLSELQILTVNLPAHLQDFMGYMSIHFPSSPLPLNLLPALKKIGPSAFALGVTTTLYNSHISLLHTHHPTAVPTIVEVLEEMDREVYSFDDQTLEVVEKVLRSLSGYRHGHSGKAVQILFSSERVTRGVKDLTEWRRIMLGRRQEDALRKARKGLEGAGGAHG
ncbi:hypothetical protein LTR78_009511 [Recurvomyces mirabilis]|uniref:Mtf2-like C-terminal domain-containing protein n=1 Tax=Recurvomyces mirabilis TaxID=574656 RepID=A0AAE0TRL3_9PEZI|nr:hypothetical protein LTR78_009511 [Recurvomyces mirabilis]KAK5152415.1 hypothetical protein LTS14_008362 [Recurvomyces mirabilis]